MTTELIKGRPNLKDTGALQQMAKAICHSEMCPPQFRNKPADAFVAIISGAEVGFQPMQALKNIAVVNGRPSIYGDGLPAVAYASGKLKRFAERFEIDGDNITAVVEIERKDVEGVRTFTFSVEDAKEAGLWGKKGPWSQYKKRMLMMRARSWAFRDTFADYLGGLHVVEESQDIPPRMDEPTHDETLDALGLVPEPAAVEEPSDDIIDAEVEPVQASEPASDQSFHDQMMQFIGEATEVADVEQLKAEVQSRLKAKEITGMEAQTFLVEIGKKIAELSDGKEEG